MTSEEFAKDDRTKDAVVRNMEIICEMVSPEFAEFAFLKWEEIVFPFYLPPLQKGD